MKSLAQLPEDILAQVRAGNTVARNEITAVFERGVRFALGQQFHGKELDETAADVHEQVLLAITNNLVTGVENLPASVRAIVKSRLSAKSTSRKRAVDPQAVENIQQTMSASDLEVLHRYYVLGESPARISEAVGINIASIQAIKLRSRQAYLSSAQIQTRRVA